MAKGSDPAGSIESQTWKMRMPWQMLKSHLQPLEKTSTKIFRIEQPVVLIHVSVNNTEPFE